MSMLGHNQPPAPIEMAIEMAKDALADLNLFLTDNPVIETGQQAQGGALFVERTRKAIQDMEDARKAEVGPLNEEVKSINERYKSARSPLDNLLNELRSRLTDFAAREEAKRIRAAEEARLATEALEIEARRAEELEREAKAGATFGEVVDVAERVIEADQAFSRFQKAERAAAVAERDTTVRLPSQLGGKALSMRTKETLVLTNYGKAIKAIGPNDKIRDAILSAARDYRKLKGSLPDGVVSETTKEL